VRAARVLGEAEVVFHDALVPAEILSLAPRAEKIAVGKRSGKLSTAQRFINKRLADAARRHQVVVRLKGGDPMLFGRAHEEISYLTRQNIAVRVVPGVTAALAASADLGVSLTQRGVSRSVVFATPRAAASERPSNWAAAVAAADTAVLYMAAGEARFVLNALLSAGLGPDKPVAIVENASVGYALAAGSLTELPALSARCAGGPAVVMIGEVFAALQAAVRAAPGRDLIPRLASQRA
jgi:uroporphyrin-III C-methyltransferase